MVPIVKTIPEIKSELEKEGIKRENTSDPHSQFFIAYIDDQIELLEEVTSLISEFGFIPFTTTSVETFLSFINQNRFQTACILSDLKMSNCSGFELRETLLKIAPEIPFSILSSYLTKEITLKGVEAQITSFLNKPLESLKLANFIYKEVLPRIRSLKEEREILLGFIQESQDKLSQAEELTLAFEQNTHDLDALNKCFGLVHTMKGASGFFQPKTMHQFVHRFEDILKSIQRNEIPLTDQVTSSILRSFDFIKQLLKEFESRNHKNYDLQQIFKEYFTFDLKAPGTLKTSKEKNVPDEPLKVIEKPQEEIRVPIALLNDFMAVSGEMTVIRNMINKCVRTIEGQFPQNKDIQILSELLAELHKLNASIQTQISNLRKIPFSTVLKPLSRIIRDLSKALGKEVLFTTMGSELAIDPLIVGILNSCLIHLIRNCLDHGIESTVERKANGKPEKGKLSISAFQKSEKIHIEISDDGGGLKEENIRKKLVKNGTHTEKEANLLSNEDLYAMIFSPGFSTAEQVTNISGRGVGMSAVKDAVDSIGGEIKIQTEHKVGTKFTLILPIPKSVLIQKCLYVSTGNMTFGIPQENIIRVSAINDQTQNLVSSVQGTDIFQNNGELLPIVKLSAALGLHSDHSLPLNEPHTNIVIVESKNRKLALSVNQILDIEDTVTKKLDHTFKKLSLFNGATFLGDSNIALILSIDGIIEKYKIHSNNSMKSLPKLIQSVNSISSTTNQSVILFKGTGRSTYAIPTLHLHRIEDFTNTKTTLSGGIEVINYRQQILPILEIDSLLRKDFQHKSNSQFNTLLILSCNNTFFGLKITSLEDIAYLKSDIKPNTTKQSCIEGSALTISDTLVTVLNLEETLEVFSKRPSQTRHIPTINEQKVA